MSEQIETVETTEHTKEEVVPKNVMLERINKKNEEINELKAQLLERDKQINDLSKSVEGNKELESKLNELQQANEQWQQKYKQTQIEAAVKLAAKDANDPADVLRFVDVGGLDVLEDGSIKGLDDVMNQLRESKPYLFAQEEKALKGRQPVDKQQPILNNGVNPFKRETFNLTKQAEILRENPELAAQLKAQA